MSQPRPRSEVASSAQRLRIAPGTEPSRDPNVAPPELAFWRSVQQVIEQIRAVQRAFIAILAQQRSALRAGDSRKLEAILKAETECLDLLQAAAAEREALLRHPFAVAGRFRSLRQLIEAVQPPGWEARLLVADEIDRASREIQQQSWAIWVLAHRAHHHYSEVLELIARGGEQAVTYGDRSEPAPRSRAAMLDACA